MSEKVEAVNLADLTETEVPESSTQEAAEFTCVVCGKPLTYSGRGRKPKYCEEHKRGSSGASKIGGSTRGSADAKAAANTLDMGYTALTVLLQMVGATQAREALQASLPGLREQNLQFLTQDKELAKKINAMGKTGGRYAFFAAQATVLGPVLVIGTQEVSTRLAERKSRPESSDDSDVPANMGGFFGDAE